MIGAAADLAARNWFKGDWPGDGEERGSTLNLVFRIPCPLQGVSRDEIETSAKDSCEPDPPVG
jgi:hypothetical protein